METLRLLPAATFLFAILSVLPPRVKGTYYFYVELQSFSNPSDRDHDGGCCDPGCDPCENYFILCLRAYGHSVDSNSCPYASYSTSANPMSGSTLTFSTALTSTLSNPVRWGGGTWPIGFQLKIRVFDADGDADDLVDYFIIENSSFPPTDNYTDFTTYTGRISSSVSIRLRYRLKCRGNWHGYDCNTRCVDDISDTSHLVCAINGTHVCQDGWRNVSNNQCNTPICREGCSTTGGTCDQPGECNCATGWNGELCDNCIERQGCAHGYCDTPNECICEDGYRGTLCDILEDPCDYLTPCVHGDCSNDGDGTYTCSCTAGYTGENCQTEIDECSPNPCLNGATCLDLVNGYVCTCPLGWSGENCGDDIDECAELDSLCKDALNCSIGCQNGGTCVDGVGTFSCECPPLYSGMNCEESLDGDQCDPLPCLNGGNCTDGFLTFTCECPSGYEGEKCEDKPDRCGDVVCGKGEVCIVVGDSFGEDGHKCQPCTSDNCDEDAAAQSDNKEETNTPIIIGSTVGAVLLVLLILLLLLLLLIGCCCRPCLFLLCPCLSRDKVEENAVGEGTLSSSHNNVSNNAMYMGPDSLLKSDKMATPPHGAMQNPLYGAPVGLKPRPPSSSTAKMESTGQYDQLKRSSKADDVILINSETGEDELVEKDPHYEQLGPGLKAGVVAAHYQKLSSASLEKQHQHGGTAYASLYKVPSTTSHTGQTPPPPPPNPPRLMPPTVGGVRPENPYIISPSSEDGFSIATTPDKADDSYAKLDDLELKKH